MALKRSLADTEQPARHNDSKRARISLSPSDDARSDSDSSAMSAGSMSGASVPSSSPGAVARGQESSASSAPSNGHQDDSDSSMESSDDSGSSTAGESDEDDDGDQDSSEADAVVNLGAPKKPKIDAGIMSGASDLASRLKAFLPQLQQANSELAEKGAGMNMEDVEDGDEHIEMSLGLGVLEQKKAEDLETLVKQHQSRSDNEPGAGDDSNGQASEGEPDVLDRLMNMEREGKAPQPSIQEVDSRPRREDPTTKVLSEDQRAELALRQSASRPT